MGILRDLQTLTNSNTRWGEPLILNPPLSAIQKDTSSWYFFTGEKVKNPSNEYKAVNGEYLYTKPVIYKIGTQEHPEFLIEKVFETLSEVETYKLLITLPYLIKIGGDLKSWKTFIFKVFLKCLRHPSGKGFFYGASLLGSYLPKNCI